MVTDRQLRSVTLSWKFLTITLKVRNRWPSSFQIWECHRPKPSKPKRSQQCTMALDGWHPRYKSRIYFHYFLTLIPSVSFFLLPCNSCNYCISMTEYTPSTRRVEQYLPGNQSSQRWSGSQASPQSASKHRSRSNKGTPKAQRVPSVPLANTTPPRAFYATGAYHMSPSPSDLPPPSAFFTSQGTPGLAYPPGTPLQFPSRNIPVPLMQPVPMFAKAVPPTSASATSRYDFPAPLARALSVQPIMPYDNRAPEAHATASPSPPHKKHRASNAEPGHHRSSNRLDAFQLAGNGVEVAKSGSSSRRARG
ncbi:hypothetical protein R3P38DRAFT_548514 [Favolaschia claudopus]|uniref:Uncharacterized protein n=1 Tax=Favolaschia claudopus TaxID=2862362 RepID=A0AAW0CIA7_9AGAR